MNASFATNTLLVSTAPSSSAVPLQPDPCSDDRCWKEKPNANAAYQNKTASSRRLPTPNTPMQRRAARQRVLKEWLTPEMIQKAFVTVPPSPNKQKKKQQQQEHLVLVSKQPTPKQHPQKQQLPKLQRQPQQPSPVVEWLARCANMSTTAGITPSASDASTKHSSTTTTTTSTASSSSNSVASIIFDQRPEVASTPRRSRTGRQHHGRWPKPRQQSTGSAPTTPHSSSSSLAALRRQPRRWLPISAKAQRLRHEMILSGEFTLPAQQQQQQQTHPLPWVPILSPGGLFSTTNVKNSTIVQFEPSKVPLRKQQQQKEEPSTTTLTANSTTPSRFHKDQMSHETMAEVEQHRQYFRTLRPQRRRIQFVTGTSSCSSLLAADFFSDDEVTLASSSCCHVASLSLQDLNIPIQRHHYHNSLLSWSTLETPAAQHDDGDGDNYNDCSGSVSPTTAPIPKKTNLASLDGSPCRIRNAYEEQRQSAHDQQKRQQRIHKLELELDQCTAKAEYVEELIRRQDEPQHQALAVENQQLRRQLMTARAANHGGSHPQMMEREVFLQEQLQQLNQEIALLEQTQQQQQQVEVTPTMRLLLLDPIETPTDPVVSSLSSHDCRSTVLSQPKNLPRSPAKMAKPTRKVATTTQKQNQTPLSPAHPLLTTTTTLVLNTKSTNQDSTTPPAPMPGANHSSRNNTADNIIITLPGKSEVPPKRSKQSTRAPTSARRRKRNKDRRSVHSSGGGLDQ